MADIVTPLATPCSVCPARLVEESLFLYAPPVITLDLQRQGAEMKISTHFSLNVNGTLRVYRLAGIVYLGAFHFTSRIVHPDQSVWFHDGQLGADASFEGWTSTLDLTRRANRVATCLLYV